MQNCWRSGRCASRLSTPSVRAMRTCPPCSTALPALTSSALHAAKPFRLLPPGQCGQSSSGVVRRGAHRDARRREPAAHAGTATERGRSVPAPRLIHPVAVRRCSRISTSPAPGLSPGGLSTHLCSSVDRPEASPSASIHAHGRTRSPRRSVSGPRRARNPRIHGAVGKRFRRPRTGRAGFAILQKRVSAVRICPGAQSVCAGQGRFLGL